MSLLQLTSTQGDLLNLSGSITGGDVTIVANDIISETDIVRFVDGENVQEVAAPSALISATSGVLTLNAAGDITVIGGDLSGEAGVNILAGGDIDFAALELNNTYDGAGDDWSFTQTTNLSEVSTITSANGGVSIVSALLDGEGSIVGGGNILFEGTQLNAQEAVDVTAVAGYVILGAASDTTYTDQWFESDTLISEQEVRDERLTVTHQTSNIVGSEINIYAANTVFDQSSGLVTTAGDLTIESARGDVLFGSLTEIDAHNRYSSTSAFGGLMDFSTETQSLLATALSTQADAQGDINLIAGGDLEFQGGRFTAAGAINTQVAGDTRILATADTDFSYVIEHDNNSLLIVDTTTVSLQQTAGFTQLLAGNGVNLDETSAVTVGVVATQAAVGSSVMGLVSVSDVSDPTQDMAITEFFLPDATGSPVDRLEDLTQDQLTAALVGIQTSDSSDGETSGGDTDPAFDFEGSTTIITAPGAEDGAQYAYLDELQGRDNVTMEEIALIEHAYRDRNVEVGIVGNLLIAYVSGQIVGVFELGSIANAMASAAVSGTIEGVVTGNLDLESLLTDIAFAGVSAGIGEIIPDIGFEQDYMNTGLLGENSQFTLGSVVNTGIETSVTAGLTTAVYGGDYADNFTSGFSTSILQLATADVQTLVGDQYNLKDENGNAIGPGEGSLGHVLTHAVVGCAAAEAQGGSCQTGAAAGAASAIYAGQLDGSSSRTASNDMAELLSGLAAAVVSSGDGEAVSIAAGIGRSGFVNNRQLHAYDLADLVEALGGGAEAIALVENMTDEQIAQFDQELFTQEYFDSISPEQQRVLAATCALIQCHLHIPQDDFLELGNDAFREELARMGGGTDYLQDRQNLLDNTTNVDAFSYDVDDIYADFELRTGRDLETDALIVSGLDGLASLANFVDGGIAFADLLRRAENGDPEAIRERDEISARLNETLANSDFIDEGFSNAADAMSAAIAEYSATVALLEAAASGTYVDPDELRDAAFFKAEFETKAVFGAAAILTPTILARVGRFTGNVPDTNVCSFHGDTLVLTNTGLQPIKDLSTSTSVWSRNPADGEMAWKAIQAQYSNPYNETVSVTVRDTAAQTEQTIVSNHIHPYFVQTTRTVVNSSEGHIYAGPLENGHWVDAAELHAGDRLLHDDGTWAEVVSVKVEEKALTAYNLTVADFHTYFVAANENAAPVWVHNNCINGTTRLPNGTEIDINISDSRLDHVLKGDLGVNGPTGGHSTNSGNVQIVGDVEVGHGGVRRAEVEINGQIKSNNGGQTTLFPDGWSDQRIVDEFSQGLRTGATSAAPGGNPRVVTPSGVTVEYVRNGDNIITFYPVFE